MSKPWIQSKFCWFILCTLRKNFLVKWKSFLKIKILLNLLCKSYCALQYNFDCFYVIVKIDGMACESKPIAAIQCIIVSQLFSQGLYKFSFICCITRHAFENNLVARTFMKIKTFKGQISDIFDDSRLNFPVPKKVLEVHFPFWTKISAMKIFQSKIKIVLVLYL